MNPGLSLLFGLVSYWVCYYYLLRNDSRNGYGTKHFESGSQRKYTMSNFSGLSSELSITRRSFKVMGV